MESNFPKQFPKGPIINNSASCTPLVQGHPLSLCGLPQYVGETGSKLTTNIQSLSPLARTPGA